MSVYCPHCRVELDVPPGALGTMVECPACGGLFHAKAPSGGQHCCPRCGSPLDAGEKICVGCGYDGESGEILRTVVDTDTRPGWLKLLGFVHECMPGLFRPPTLILYLFCSALSLVLDFFALMLFCMNVWVTGPMMACGAMMLYGQGCAFLTGGSVEGMKSAFMDFTPRQWNAFWLVFLAPYAVVIGIMYWVARYTDVMN